MFLKPDVLRKQRAEAVFKHLTKEWWHDQEFKIILKSEAILAGL